MIDDFPVDLLIYCLDLARTRLIDGVEQCWEGVAQTETAPAAMTDVEHPFELFEQGAFVPEFWILPANRMASRRL